MKWHDCFPELLLRPNAIGDIIRNLILRSAALCHVEIKQKTSLLIRILTHQYLALSLKCLCALIRCKTQCKQNNKIVLLPLFLELQKPMFSLGKT